MELKICKLISQIILSVGMSVVAVADESSSMPSVSVEFCGRLRHGVVAIGSESAGTTVSAGRIIWEVQLLTDADRRFAETHHKETVVVSGRLRKVRGVETKDRWVIEERQSGQPLQLTPEERRKLAKNAQGIDPDTL